MYPEMAMKCKILHWTLWLYKSFFFLVHRCADAMDRFEIVDFLTRFQVSQVSQVHQFQINTRSTMSFKIVIICEWLDKKKEYHKWQSDYWQMGRKLWIGNFELYNNSGVEIMLRKCKSFQIQRHHHSINMAMKIISKVL